MKEPPREILELRCLRQSENMACACGKRSKGDKQKVLEVDSRVQLDFCQDVRVTVAKMECQVCKQVHRMAIREVDP